MFNKKSESDYNGPQDSTTTSSSPAASPTPTPTPTPTPAPAASAPGASTVLAEGCNFKGDADVTGTFRIEGNAEGDLKASETLVVGETGNVKAEVTTRRAVMNGRFRGKINASDRVELQAGSDVKADLSARNMVMEDGVKFEGNLKIGS
jgi:cytoskeletal protein CcmA (bactofilin family)